jgi:hypothetical protein
MSHRNLRERSKMSEGVRNPLGGGLTFLPRGEQSNG